MKSIRELLDERAQLIDQAKAILDAADKEKRGLSEAEEKQYNSLLDQAASLKRSAQARERGAEQEKTESAQPWKPEPAGSAQRSGPVEAGEYRSFRQNEKLAGMVPYDDLRGGVRPDELDLGRFVRGVVTGDWKRAEAEYMQFRGNVINEGYILPSPMSVNVIDLARSKSVLMTAGALTAPMTSSTLDYARLVADAVPAFKQPGVEASEDSAMTLGTMTFTARTEIVVIRVNRETLEDAPNATGVLSAALGQAMSLKMDYSGMFGTGANGEPGPGLYYDPDVNEVLLDAAGGVKLSTHEIMDAMQKTMEGNADAKTLIYSPRTIMDLLRVRDGQGNPVEIDKAIRDMQRLVSTQIPNNLTVDGVATCSAAFVGDFGGLTYAPRTQLVFEVAREASDVFKKHQVLIKVTMRGDWGTTRPSWMTRIKGILAR